MPSIGPQNPLLSLPTLNRTTPPPLTRSTAQTNLAPTATPPKAPMGTDKAKSLFQKAVANTQSSQTRRNLETKSQIIDRLNASIANVHPDAMVKAKETRLTTVGKVIGKMFAGLFANATNLVILTGKVIVNAVARPLSLLVAAGYGAIKGALSDDPNMSAWKGVKDTVGSVNQAFTSANEKMDNAMKSVEQFFGKIGEGQFKEAFSGSARSVDTESATEASLTLTTAPLDIAANALGMNLEAKASGQELGQVGQQGNLALDMGATMTVAGGVEGMNNFFDGLEKMASGGKVVQLGKELTQQFEQIKGQILTDLAQVQMKLSDTTTPPSDTEKVDLEKEKLNLAKLSDRATKVMSGGKFLVAEGDKLIEDGAFMTAKGIMDTGIAANGMTNLLAGADKASHVFGLSEQGVKAVGTTTQVLGSSITMITSGIEAGVEHVREKQALMRVDRCETFTASATGKTKDEHLVVDAVQQFQRNNIETAKISKFTKFLKGALAVTAAAMVVATFVAVAITPVGWAIGGGGTGGRDWCGCLQSL